VQQGIGWTDWGATAPDFRGRGLQRALLCHRLRLADGLGLVRVHTCTGAPAPGDPQHSYANILRCGFAETRLRANLAPAVAG
jgi:GNAT superfamily N-acetyltransferase